MAENDLPGGPGWDVRHLGVSDAIMGYAGQASGTMRWVESFGGYHHFGLNRRTARFTRRVTANVLRGFADGPAAARHPARHNLRQVHEWAGDPVGSQQSLW